MTLPGEIDVGDGNVATPVGATAAAGPNVLRIVTGLHGGASRRLGAQEMIVVGSGEDCDVVLADPGVARHHALVISMAGSFSLRALDAPLRLDGRVVAPGDPVPLLAFQRIELGEVALAVGPEVDDNWTALLPSYQATGTTSKAASRAVPRALWLLGAAAVLAVGIFGVMFVGRVRQPVVPPQDRVAALVAAAPITDRVITLDPSGIPVLGGTVDDNAMRDDIARRLTAAGVVATVDLRTGDDIARDVREVLRTQGLNAQTRYLGNGQVEVVGRFSDMQALRDASVSRAMQDVKGVRSVVPRNLSPPVATATAATAQPTVAKKSPEQIVRLVGGPDAHALAADGTRYAVGSVLPDGSKLISIGTKAFALMPDGETMRQVKPSQFSNVKGGSSAPQPPPSPAAAAGIAAQATADAPPASTTPPVGTAAVAPGVRSQRPAATSTPPPLGAAPADRR